MQLLVGTTTDAASQVCANFDVAALGAQAASMQWTVSKVQQVAYGLDTSFIILSAYQVSRRRRERPCVPKGLYMHARGHPVTGNAATCCTHGSHRPLITCARMPCRPSPRLQVFVMQLG